MMKFCSLNAADAQVIRETRELWASSAELADKMNRVDFFDIDFLKAGGSSL